MDDLERSAGYDTNDNTNTGDTDIVNMDDTAAMGNLYPLPTQSYHNQPPDPNATTVSGYPGLNTFANQPTVQAPPVIQPIYPPYPPPAVPPGALQPVPPPLAQPPVPVAPPQGQQSRGRSQGRSQGQTMGGTTIAAPRPSVERAALMSVMLGFASLVISLIPVCGLLALIPGLMGVFYGWRGMKTRGRNLALFGILLSVLGIAFAFAVVV